MAVESSEDIFNKWLTKKLETFDIEDEVMSSYISSIITTDDVDTDKKDNLKDILQDLLQGADIDALCKEILDEWSACNGKKSNVPENEQSPSHSSLQSINLHLSNMEVRRNSKRPRRAVSPNEDTFGSAILIRS
ncbi:hypothetical protein AVEN_217454-1 [Araneus ventricosus]|uniref:Coiled-coil domain-containing protein 43 n=1 Tax=Araneus ventricosus TaxID=182803 RepID=A0A4Y2TWA6_ARAVE|nr:hypothetical protein AVEN_217454-1 [Araneus ventricosus]